MLLVTVYSSRLAVVKLEFSGNGRGKTALLALFLAGARLVAAPRSVILTTDCGTEVDDQWAIVYLLLSPQIKLEGIVTTHAPNLKPPASAASAECARQIARDYLASNVPVFAGSPVPLAGPREPRMNGGVRFIIGTSRAFSSRNRLAVLAIGAATDVASALLADATLARRIEILSMGFDDWPGGGDPWNVKNDPAAYQVILSSPVPLTVGTTKVTRRHLRLDLAQARQLTAGKGPTGDFLYGIFEKWLRENPELAARQAGPKEWVLWDLVAPAHLLGMTRQKSVPRPKLNADLSFSHSPTRRTVGWITGIEERRLWADFRARLK